MVVNIKKTEKSKLSIKMFIISTMQRWTPGIKINTSNKSKVKNPAN